MGQAYVRNMLLFVAAALLRWPIAERLSEVFTGSRRLIHTYAPQSFGLIFVLITYLLFTLFFVVKISFNFEGALIKSF